MILIKMSGAQEILGNTALEFPSDFQFPYQVIVRTAYVNYKPKFLAGETFKIPGYGVLTTKGRWFSLVLDEKYRAAKGYPEKIEGIW